MVPNSATTFEIGNTAGLPHTCAWQTLRESADYGGGSHTEGQAGERAGECVCRISPDLAHAAESAALARGNDL